MAQGNGWEVLMHSTYQWNVLNILKSRYINIIGDHDERKDYPGSAPAVYLHYLFKDMKNQAYMSKRNIYWNYGSFPTNGSSSAVMCFRMGLLQDLPFRVCKHMNAGCYENDERTLMEKAGNLKQLPDLTALRTHINSQMEEKEEEEELSAEKRKSRQSGMVYVSSHEIAVLKKIPVRYLAYILVRGRRTRLHLEHEIAKKAGGYSVPIIDTIYLYRRMRVKHWTAQCAAMEYMSKHGARAGESEAIMDAIVANYKNITQK